MTTCAWFLDNVHAYAIGALDAGDRARMEQHLDEVTAHDGCYEALAEALELATALDSSLPPVKPGASVFDAVLREIEEVPVLRPRSAPEAAAPSRQSWTEVMGWGLAIAASLMLVLLNNSNESLEEKMQSAEQKASRLAEVETQLETERRKCRVALEQSRESIMGARSLIALLDKPDTRVVSFAPQAEPRPQANAVVASKEGRAFVVSSTLKKIPGKDYQLWIIRGKEAPIPAGFMRIAADGVAVGEFDPGLLAEGAANALAVSIEPEGGRLTPTEVILVAKLG